MSYYDVDAILSAGQKVPCEFTLDIPHLGYLDNTSSALKEGTKLDLPLWLAETLGFNGTLGKPFASIDLPAALSPTVISALKASPKSVDLRAQAQFFYSLAARMLDLFGEDDERLGEVIYESFRVRSVAIGEHAANAGGSSRTAGGVGVGQDGVEFLRGLEEEERKLFKAAHESAKATKRWMNDIKRN